MFSYSRDEELYASMAIVKAKGIGPKTWKKIFERYGSAAGAIENLRQWADEGLVRKGQVNALASGGWERDVEQELEYISRKKLRIVLWRDPEYPERLKQISSPPALIYCRGDVSLLNNHCLAVVGSRQSSGYGKDMALNICRDLSASGLTIVSGFAYGIDRQAHMAAVDNPGSTIAVLGTGIDLVYPAANKDLWVRIAEKGLILTEFLPGTKPDPGNFPFRNRIISGLCHGVLVVQSAIKSGSMITAELALDQNKEVFAVPGAVHMDNYDGCNHLIKQGAHLVQSAEDVLEVLASLVKVAPVLEAGKAKGEKVSGARLPEGLSPEEKEIADNLAGRNRTHIDALTMTLGWPSQKVSQTLVLLEIKGVVRKEPGMHYSLCD